MEKYGVVTEKKPKKDTSSSKEASAKGPQCPRCLQRDVVRLGNIYRCNNCGTAPFEHSL